MSPQDAAALLDLILERAPKLRAAGIRKVNLEGASIELDPEGGPEVVSKDDDVDDRTLSGLLAGTGESRTTKKERPPL